MTVNNLNLKTHCLGFPRIGANRELKKVTESYWKNLISLDELLAAAENLKRKNWQIQKNAGLSHVAAGDFSLYDHILDTTIMLGAIPPRFTVNGNTPKNCSEIDLAFRMARGDVQQNIPAMQMMKWFDTNYHYIVPEFSSQLSLLRQPCSVIRDTRTAAELGFTPKPVLVGPITYLALSKNVDNIVDPIDRWKLLDKVTEIYQSVLLELSESANWIQLDEPILCTDLSAEAKNAFQKTYQKLNGNLKNSKILLATYFGTLDDNLDLALTSGCGGLHIDLVRGNSQLDSVAKRLPPEMILSAGIVDGRNIWRTDLSSALGKLWKIQAEIGRERIVTASSCSLIHCPVDLNNETKIDSELKNWMAFSVQKCNEITLLSDLLDGKVSEKILEENAQIIRQRKTSPRVVDEEVQKRCTSIQPAMFHRNGNYAERKKSQQSLNLPLFPTTTIGSFPQTSAIRETRRKFRNHEMTETQYESFLQNEIVEIVRKQEELGLDVLVHGEPERNDMVEYFGEQLNGFCFSENGWVQSYGNRYVKPPIIFGDVSRKHPMTVSWIKFARSQTSKLMKGMLTGPVTILCWSFVRDDLPRMEVCRQIALAIRDEVADLENAGIRVIQIDEAALREGLPLRKRDADNYLTWATDAFRLASSGANNHTQIHTHMCYSEFNTIIHWIARMDSDVVSIESSRSGMQLLEAFQEFEYPNEIGPGVYDIHSPRIPSTEEIIGLLKKALQYIPKERLWVNPDCGLKTREWTETLESLKNMVAAANVLRNEK
ncbi:MAG: 5-methyltetrahydropteroyltriglutamate--homocysteine S-methyltransferase [Planctomycetaceae bacterium]|jgi:5-methyltetrahydropteroyltriglutamate--homocysteine methyltransferase|nr:5-methyltetrahydropteroyltriglutamate--homocysteine S-methyltransferase [Planctomycetaceae bacterium]